MKKQVSMRTAAICLAAVMTAAQLAACGGSSSGNSAKDSAPTAESLSGDVASALSKVKSNKMNVSVDFKGTVSVPSADQEADFSMKIDEDTEQTYDPYVTHATGTLAMDFNGESNSMDVEAYAQVDDDSLITYSSSDEGGTWTKTTTDLDQDTLENYTPEGSGAIYEEIADGDLDAKLEEDTEKVDGDECYVMTVTLEGDDIGKLLSASGIEGVTDTLDEDALEDKSADVTVYINKETNLPAKITGDMKEIGDAMFDSLLGTALSGVDYEVSMDKFDIEQTISEYDGTDEIEIPDEALDAEEGTTSSGMSDGTSATSSEAGSSETSSDEDSDTAGAVPAGSASDILASAPETGTADWSGMEFALDGTSYKIPFAYSDISSEWSFNLADYGYSDGYVTNPGDQQSSVIALTNSRYDMDFSIGTINLSDTTQDITENSIWAVRLGIEYASSYPTLTLPGNITWGSSLQDIVNAYGKPSEDPYYSDSLGYYELDYETDNYQTMTLTVYDDGGLKAISMEDFSL